MSWGFRITILYLSFVALIVTLVVLCYGQKVELVSKDYYRQELQYQDRIDAINNANAATHTINHAVEANGVLLTASAEFMQAGFEGMVNFFRPSDSSKDFKTELKFDADGKQMITGDKLEKGLYKMQLSWQSGGKNYFKEQVITIK
ncbi:MAG: FixH family protein [Bacteroidia bacterium]|nr:FixH family protein [Bacteroidia bacterium]